MRRWKTWFNIAWVAMSYCAFRYWFDFTIEELILVFAIWTLLTAMDIEDKMEETK